MIQIKAGHCLKIKLEIAPATLCRMTYISHWYTIRKNILTSLPCGYNEFQSILQFQPLFPCFVANESFPGQRDQAAFHCCVNDYSSIRGTPISRKLHMTLLYLVGCM